MKKMFVSAMLLTSLFACKKEETKQASNEFKGPKVSLYHGKTWSTVTLSKSGVPEKLTLSLDDELMNSVKMGAGSGDHSHDDMAMVPIHQKGAEATPFKFVMVNWNPVGHEPVPIYGTPHFDLHFYMTTEQEVMGFTDMAKLTAAPAPEYLPANHIGGAPVPQMGMHWIDVTSPELNGAPFTQTFIFGSHDSKVVFYEPMITHSFLKNTASFERSIPQPAKVSKTGYYPTKMTVRKVAGAVEVSLEGFQQRQAS